jgi:hypothetical protein
MKKTPQVMMVTLLWKKLNSKLNSSLLADFMNKFNDAIDIVTESDPRF